MNTAQQPLGGGQSRSTSRLAGVQPRTQWGGSAACHVVIEALAYPGTHTTVVHAGASHGGHRSRADARAVPRGALRCRRGPLVRCARDIANLYAPHLPSPAAMAAWFRPLQDPDPGRSPHRVRRDLRRRRWRCRCAPAMRPEPFCPHRHLCGMAAPSGAPMQRLCCAVLRNGAPVAALMLYRPAGRQDSAARNAPP